MSDTTAEINELVVSFIANVRVNDERSNEIAGRFTDLIANKKVKLLQLILALKDRFLSEDDQERADALACLSAVLCSLKPEQLLKNDVSVIFNFYMSKLDDEALLQQCLRGLNALVSMKYAAIDETAKLLTFLKDNYTSSNHLAAVRYIPFCILDAVQKKWIDQLSDNKNFGTLYIESYIKVASGEKDPRNLLLSFSLNKVITTKLRNFAAAHYSHQLFDILFSYFPITFKPPKDDAYKISNADLKLALRQALSASDIFAADALGNLIDKLAATSPAIKNDTLLTLLACLDTFGGKPCVEYWLPMWNALKFEIMHSSDGSENSYMDPIAKDEPQNLSHNQSNYRLSLDVLRSVAKQLVGLDKAIFVTYATHIIEELKPNFQYTKDLRQSCGVLAAIGSANLVAFNEIIDQTLPLFLENTSEISKLKLMLLNLSFFLDSYITLCKGLQGNESDLNTFIKENHLNDQKDEILMILGMALTSNSKIEVTVRTLSVIQFTKLIKMQGYLTREEVALIIQYLTETILTDTNKNIYYACLEGLKVISETYEDLVYDVCLKQLLDLLPNRFNELVLYHKDEEIIQIDIVLKVILDFTTSRHTLIKESIVALIRKLLDVYNTGDDEAVDYCFVLLSTIYSLFDNNIVMMDIEDVTNIKKISESDIFAILDNDSASNAILLDDQNLSLISNLLYFLNAKSKREIHQEELIRYNKLFIDEYHVISQSSRLVLPWVKVLEALDKDASFAELHKVMDSAVTLVRNSSTTQMSSFEKLGYMELITTLVNKWFNGPEENTVIEKYVDWNNHTTVNLEMIAWIAKGLIMKNSPVSEVIVSKFLELLNDTEYGVVSSKLFELFVVDISSLGKIKGITWNNNVKMLYKQKFFNDVFQKLVASYGQPNLSLDIKCNYLTALSLILKHTPNKLVEQFMNDLLPMLLQALEMPNTEVRISALDTLKDTTEKFSLLITENIDTLLPLLLKLVVPGSEYNNVTVRLLALKLIGLLANAVPLNYLQPYKQEVINSLLATLSDKKRVVRKQCIDTRQIYFELGQVPFE